MNIYRILYTGIFLVVLAGCNSPAPKAKDASAVDSAADIRSKLVGEWTRTDGGYKLKILSASPDGTLDAGYFNPNPIHVARAEWINKNNNIFIFVELRDVNYPGSAYTLQFFPSENILAGNYYQAVEGTNFDVQFVKEIQ